MGNKNEAIQHYRSSIREASGDMKWFSKVMQEDSRYLIKHGINPFDIPLMIDYLKINAHG
jgi:hypothetical protein